MHKAFSASHTDKLSNLQHQSERAQTLQDIDAAVEIAACSYLLASDEVEEEEIEEEIKEHIHDL